MKRIIVSAVAVATSLFANAQSNEESKWSITPRAGVTISDFSNDKMEIYSPRGGYGIGVEAERRLSKLIGFSAGVFYTKQEVGESTQNMLSQDTHMKMTFATTAGKNPPSLRQSINEDETIFLHHSTGLRHKMDQISVPLLLNFHVWKGLTVKAGLEYVYLMKAKHTSNINEYIKETDPAIYSYDANGNFIKIVPSDIMIPSNSPVQIIGQKIERNSKWSEDISNQYHRSTISIPVGVAYNYKDFELDARYLFGITNLISNDDFGNHLRTSTFLITLGYRIGIL